MEIDAITAFRLGEGQDAHIEDTLPLGQEYALQSAGDAFHALANTMPQMVWSTLPDGSHDYYNLRWYEFTGVPFGSTDGEGWAEMFHAEDQPNAWENWRHSLETGDPYEVEYRLRHHSGEYRWMIGRALPILNENGKILRWIGTCTDIEDQKRTALQNEILSQELSHRIKNIFAVVASLIGLQSRANPAFAEPAEQLLGRIRALGRAHEFVRPHSEKSRPEVNEVTLSALLDTVLGSYPAFSEGRIVVEGADIDIGSKAATPIALVFHELATNAMKYGALSVPDGRIRIELFEEGETVRFIWSEHGAPPHKGDAMEQGFGSRLIDLSIRQQLSGSYEREWTDDGLKLTMTVKTDRLQGN